MAWIESHTVLGRHRKVLELAKEMRLKPAHIIGHLHLLWHSALEQQENGDLTKWSDDLICELSGSPCEASHWVRLLQKHGWLDNRILHDWWDYAGNYLQSKYSHNPEKWKDVKQLHSTCKAVAPNPDNPPKITEPKITEYKADFDVLWGLYPNKEGKQAAQRHVKATVKCPQDFENCKKAINNYLKSDRFKKGFVKLGSTFFNDWQAWIEPSDDMMKDTAQFAKTAPSKPKIERVLHCHDCGRAGSFWVEEGFKIEELACKECGKKTLSFNKPQMNGLIVSMPIKEIPKTVDREAVIAESRKGMEDFK